MSRFLLALTLGTLVVATSACGSTKHAAAPPTTIGPATTAAATTTAPAGPGGLSAEANAAATGDIPDNQVFLSFRNSRAGYAMKYPEGWAQRGAASVVAFRDKNNIVRVVIAGGVFPTTAAVTGDLRRAGVHVVSAPQGMTLPAGRAIKVVYSTRSKPNAVTGKRVTLQVDRYYVSDGRRHAIVDLGTPVGVDNVDAYRLIIQSFRWR